MLSAQNSRSLRATACTLCLSEAKLEAEAEAGGKDVLIARSVHNNLFVDSIEYERKWCNNSRSNYTLE